MLADQFIGQPAAIQQIQTAITASKQRSTILPHTLLIAGPGVGKTYLAERIAHEVDAPFTSIAMPADRKYLFNMMCIFPGVLLIDEIHQADRKTLDALLPFLLDGMVRNGRMTVENKRLTVIAATTDPQKMPDAFRSRFRLQPRFTDYTNEEIAEIITMKATREQEFVLPAGVAEELAAASLGNPRQAKHLLETYIDLVLVNGNSTSVPDVLRHIGYSRDGLRPDHIQYLRALEKQGGVAAQRTLAQMVLLPDGAMRWIEQDLLRLGIIGIGSTGRELRSMNWADQLDEVPSEEVAFGDCDLNPYTLEPRT
jgi:Holliday junction resolvasome RuvABC ATP-dependent DNA helicase subunit